MEKCQRTYKLLKNNNSILRGLSSLPSQWPLWHHLLLPSFYSLCYSGIASSLHIINTKWAPFLLRLLPCPWTRAPFAKITVYLIPSPSSGLLLECKFQENLVCCLLLIPYPLEHHLTHSSWQIYVECTEWVDFYSHIDHFFLFSPLWPMKPQSLWTWESEHGRMGNKSGW